MIPAKHFYVIRHGESEANVQEVQAGGEWDTPLTDLGRDQARAVQSIVKQLTIKPQVIVHSHLSRARDTASIINEVLDLAMHEMEDVAEQYCGAWGGVPWKEIRELVLQGENPPDGETHEEFSTRVHRGFKAALEHNEPVLVACHGGVFRGLCAPYGVRLPRIENCVLHEFEPHGKEETFPWTVWEYSSGDRRPAEVTTESYYAAKA